MCFWGEIAFFNCDGTVSRQKHLCSLVPDDGYRAGVVICDNYETPEACKHSQTERTVPHRAMYHHVCNRSMDQPRRKWTPSIRVPDIFVTAQAGKGGKLKDSVQFQWCDGSLRSLEDIFNKHAGSFNWWGGDLLKMEEEEVCRLIGKGKYEHWVGVWSGKTEKAEDEVISG
jgi:hypothetical protein